MINNMKISALPSLPELITLLTGFLLIAFGSVGLLTYEYVDPNQGDREAIAKTTSTTNDVKRKYQSSMLWNKISNEEPIYNNDEVITGENGGATITLDDGTILEVPKRSLVRISSDQDFIDINLIKGSTRVIGSATATSGAGTQKIRVTKDSASKVIQGQKSVNLVTIGNDLYIEDENDEIEAVSDTEPVVAGETGQNIDPKVLTPSSGSSFSPIDNRTISFQIEEYIQDYVLALYEALDSPTVNQIRLSEGQTQGEFKVLAPGSYYIVYHHKDERWKRPFHYRSFSIEPYPEIKLSQDEKLLTVEPGQEIPLYEDLIPNLNYNIQIKGPKGISPEANINNSIASFQAIRAGNYEYRIKVGEEWKDWNQLEIDLVDTITVPNEFKKQQIAKPFNRPTSIKLKINDPLEALEPYIFRVYTQAGDIVNYDDRESRSKEVTIKVNKAGSYRWLVARKSEAETLKVRDGMPRVDVMTPVAVSKQPKDRKVVVSNSRNLKTKLTFEIENNYQKQSNLLLAKDREFKDLVEEYKLEANQESKIVEVPKLGQYFWKISPIDDQYYQETPTLALSIDLPPKVKLFIPKRVIMTYMEEESAKLKRDVYLIKLPEIENVQEYRIIVYETDRAKNVLHQEESKDNLFPWSSNRTGKLAMKYYIIDKWGRKSKLSPVIPLYFPISPLEDFVE
jgi:hypothetical protein